jgi:hypothetical protein
VKTLKRGHAEATLWEARARRALRNAIPIGELVVVAVTVAKCTDLGGSVRDIVLLLGRVGRCELQQTSTSETLHFKSTSNADNIQRNEQ